MSEVNPCPQEVEALDIIESMLDVADMKCTGPLYADDPPRNGLCRIPEEDAAILRQYIADRRARPANKPLTFEQLRQMDGEPVWIVDIKHQEFSGWMQYAYDNSEYNLVAFWIFGNEVESTYSVDDYGKTWLAYRRPPEVCIGVDFASGHDSTVYCRKPEAANGK